jgi:hypothetical protein
MLRITSNDWPLQLLATPQPHHESGGIAPLRREFALARHAESRSPFDKRAGRRLAIWRALVDIYRGTDRALLFLATQVCLCRRGGKMDPETPGF